MNDVNELWSSPWRKLQKNLASGFGVDGAGQTFAMSDREVYVRPASSSSWLVRARSRKVHGTRIVQ
ncbi:MAG TPA: hypothetical protein VGD63_13225 [Steroidobacteraceae bacterium]